MVLLISFLIGLQILDALAASPPLQFVYPPCSSLEVKAAADAAINELNAHRSEGYVFRLQRIVDNPKISRHKISSLYCLFFPFLPLSTNHCDVESW